MSAPVRIEARAWGDLRFATLARLLGLVDADHALIKVARLWSWQTEHFAPDAPTYEVDADTIESVLGPGGPAAMVRARLAEETPTGYRIRGTEGQIEWCDNLSSKRQQAGRARADGALRDAKGRLLPHSSGEPGNNSPAKRPAPGQRASSAPPAKSSAPSPSPSPEDQSPPPARDPAVPSPAPIQHPEPTADIPPGGDRKSPEDLAREARQRRRTEIWGELEGARRRTARELGIEARPLPAQDPGERELASLLACGDLERTSTDARHAIAMAVLEARRDRSVQWLTGGIFHERAFRRLVGMTEADATRPRAGPRGGAERAAKRDVRVGQIQPEPPSAYDVPDGEMPL